MNRKHPIISRRLQVLVQECGEDLTCELLRIFLTDYPAWIDRLSVDVNQDDRIGLHFKADQMKSGAANLGAVELAHLLETLENAPKETPQHELKNLIEQINVEYEKSGLWVQAFLQEELHDPNTYLDRPSGQFHN